MDKAQWQEYRTTIIEQVTAKLDAMEPIAEAMDAWEGSFEGKFEISGNGVLKDSTRVQGVPLFEEDEDGYDDEDEDDYEVEE